ncbi:MAG: hypothetical protein HND27_04475 [Bacteroidetes bacterium]|nr:hypothetical protein [Bacteroidota bacterium]MCL4279845.1 hypothetical protein [Ignavibacteriaceae bacterium]WKZ74705.1 MAG: hypothetical protein QY303_11210 [Vicingaceae bacterium]CAG0999430.1 hypothetical protein FLAV_02850 [Flavobacteriales bacterium]NOG95013.1 hypothetical protein [Bacteroidota bacterium]
MKKLKNVFFTIAAVVLFNFISCKKEETKYQASKSPSNVQNNFREGFGGTIDLISDSNVFLQIVRVTDEYYTIIQDYELDISNAYMVDYSDSTMKLVAIPIIDSNNQIYSTFATKIVDSIAVGFYITRIEGTSSYYNSIGNNPIFYNHSAIPFSGEMLFYSFERNNPQPSLIITIEIEDDEPLTWKHHGGHATWSDCVSDAYSQTWAIISGLIKPYATFAGVALGCL